jgi:hypothetical protein
LRTQIDAALSREKSSEKKRRIQIEGEKKEKEIVAKQQIILNLETVAQDVQRLQFTFLLLGNLNSLGRVNKYFNHLIFGKKGFVRTQMTVAIANAGLALSQVPSIMTAMVAAETLKEKKEWNEERDRAYYFIKNALKLTSLTFDYPREPRTMFINTFLEYTQRMGPRLESVICTENILFRWSRFLSEKVTPWMFVGMIPPGLQRGLTRTSFERDMMAANSILKQCRNLRQLIFRRPHYPFRFLATQHYASASQVYILMNGIMHPNILLVKDIGTSVATELISLRHVDRKAHPDIYRRLPRTLQEFQSNQHLPTALLGAFADDCDKFVSLHVDYLDFRPLQDQPDGNFEDRHIYATLNPQHFDLRHAAAADGLDRFSKKFASTMQILSFASNTVILEKHPTLRSFPAKFPNLKKLRWVIVPVPEIQAAGIQSLTTLATLYPTYFEDMRAVADACPDLEYLEIYWSKDSWSLLEYFLKKCPRLKTLGFILGVLLGDDRVFKENNDEIANQLLPKLVELKLAIELSQIHVVPSGGFMHMANRTEDWTVWKPWQKEEKEKEKEEKSEKKKQFSFDFPSLQSALEEEPLEMETQEAQPEEKEEEKDIFERQPTGADPESARASKMDVDSEQNTDLLRAVSNEDVLEQEPKQDFDVESIAAKNTDFVHVVDTRGNTQLVVMRISTDKPFIGVATHAHTIHMTENSGLGHATINGQQYKLARSSQLKIPKGANFTIETLASDLHLSTMYTPPKYPEKTVYLTRTHAELDARS